jgi:clan AA aspartic protease (TIGR02281 family)
MMQVVKSASLLLVGVTVGWWLHGISFTAAPIQQPIHTPSPPAPQIIAPRVSAPTAKSAANTPPNAAGFQQLLNGQEFEQALTYYEQALSLDDRYQSLLKPELEAYLQSCLQACPEGVFVDLVELWLATYYEDIPVLLLLAEHQRLLGLPEEAASTLQIAATYALQPGQQELVDAAVQDLVASTEQKLSRQKNWIELLGFYEYLKSIDLGNSEYLLRQDGLSQLIGEPEQIRYTIPLTRKGDHFLVTTSFNDLDQLTLMIDTGASLTTLGRESFAGLVSSDYEYRGSHMFNTANGLAQGEVYRAASIGLGDTQIDDIDVAVLDFQPAGGVDGVLGMNVLRNYRFEIDQDELLLYLRSRR